MSQHEQPGMAAGTRQRGTETGTDAWLSERTDLLVRYREVVSALGACMDQRALDSAARNWRTLEAERLEDPDMPAAQAFPEDAETEPDSPVAGEAVLNTVTLLTDEERAHLSEEIGRLEDEKEILEQRYCDLLPVVPLSRCPLTGERYERPFDAAGLDGLWWNQEDPMRPDDVFPPTFVALSGAMRLADPPAALSMPFLVQPGPGKPFVLPRLLEDDGARAVLYQLPVGPNTGWVIGYFSEQAQWAETQEEIEDLERVNEWGLDVCLYKDEADGLAAVSAEMEPGEEAFDLVPWLLAGKLLWIAPGDARMTLRSGVRDCPYLACEGTEKMQYLLDGKVWEEDGAPVDVFEEGDVSQEQLAEWLQQVEAYDGE